MSPQTMEPLAIIGMACRFPQEGDTNENFWNLLMSGKPAMTPFPGDRINQDGHYHPDVEHGGTFHVKGGHFMRGDPAEFDHQFFSITKNEVLCLDPQQRLLMENVYHALENAGIPLSRAMGSNTSVFSSGFNHDYLQLLGADPEIKLKYKPMGTSNSILSGRISWFFDFKGPSLTVDTACSSSMVAFHLGAQSLRDGESDMSVVCGVNVFTYPTDWFGMDHHGFLAGDGKSYSFDHRASGYSRGEGVATVVLKRLSAAIRDGDTIRAVVRATGLNQDGRTPGITLPSAAAQESMIRSVYARGGLKLDETAYIEAHATGTAAGDPIEARAIASSFDTAKRREPLVVGAVKSAIGHTEGASGLAGIIKSVMILESGVIPPNTNFEKANPKIPLDKWRLKLPLEPMPWPSAGTRQVSINSFGFSGTNGHVVLQDAYHYLESRKLDGRHRTLAQPGLNGHGDSGTNGVHVNGAVANGDADGAHVNGAVANGDANGAHINGTVPNGDAPEHASNGTNGTTTNTNGHSVSPSPPLLFPFSAFDEAGVQRNMHSIAAYYTNLVPPSASDEQTLLQDLAYTLAAKRTSFPWRSYTLASSLAELVDRLTQGTAVPRPERTRSTPNIGFVFTGQGAQWFAMGRELLAYPVFERSLSAASGYMRGLGSEWELYDELLKDKSTSRIDEPSLAHPACAAIQVAIVDLLSSWNLRPTRVVGHSSGEIAAAYCAGKLSREAAWKVAYYRGYVSSRVATSGAMLAVGLTEADLKGHLERIGAEQPGELVVACYNSPKNHTVSGDEAKIDALKAVLDEQGVFARKLKVTTAYHSSHMRAVAAEYLSLLGTLDKPADGFGAEMYSTVTGARIEDDLTAQYWVDNLVSPVRFADALAKMALESDKGSLRVNTSNSAVQEIVEVGPHSALRSAIREVLAAAAPDPQAIGYHAVLDRNAPGVETLLGAVGALYSRGSLLDVARVNGALRAEREPSMLVDLPPYVFNHSQTIWYESRLSRNFRLRKYPRHDLFGAPASDWNVEEPSWRNFIRISEQPWLRDHVVTGSIVYPGVGYVIMAIEASRQIADPAAELVGFHLKDIAIKSALIVPDDKDGIEVKFAMSRMDESSLEKSKTWRQWRVTSYNPVADDWVEHCTGYISTRYTTLAGPVDNGLEEAAEASASERLLQDGLKRCTTPVTINYDNLDTIGLHFGPLFQNLSSIRVNKGKGEVTADISVPDVAKAMPKNFLHPHMIHPATLDSMMHLFIAGVLDITNKNTLSAPMVPTFIKEVRFSAKTDSSPGHKFRGLGASAMTGFQKFNSDITIWDAETGQERIAVRGWSGKSLGSEISTAGARKLCHTVEWKPDLELTRNPRFRDVVLASEGDNAAYRDNVRRLQLASVLFVTMALDELEGYAVDSFEGHFAKYYDWCFKQREDLRNHALPHLDFDEWKRHAGDERLRNELFARIARENADGELLVRMGTNLAAVLRREVDPLQLMFGQDGILNELYRNMVESGNLPPLLRAYLEIVHHNTVNLKILEIGAGTGSLTAPVLEALSPGAGEDGVFAGDSSIATYTYTDVSAGFFERAKEKFKRWRSILEFRTFNIENDAADQGLELGTYDFIFAGNVIHATGDLKKVLSNLRSLLKPSGKLVMHEGIRSDLLWLPLSFGQLPGWWLSVEPNRKWCPSISEKEWDAVLRDAGFAGIGTVLRDREVEEIHGQSIMVAGNGASAGRQEAKGRKIYIISSPATEKLAAALQTRMASEFGLQDCFVVSLSDLSDKELIDDTCISLVDLDDTPVLASLMEETYRSVNHILATSDGVLWLSGDFEKHPEQHLITGVVRTVRWERDLDAPNLVTLSVAQPRPSDDTLVDSIVSVFQHQFVNDLDADSRNAEYLLRDNEILTSRLIDANNVNAFIHSNFAEADPKPAPLGEAGRPVMLDTSSPGSLSALHFATDPVWSRPLADNEVEVEIRAVGLNFRDVLIAMGEHVAACLGNEAAGYVSRVGKGVTNVQVGDRVVYMNGLVDGGCLKTFGRQVADAVVKLPDSVSFEDAASLPCVYSTAIHGLYDIAHLSEAESVLIHAAAGGVGQAAIQLANLVGAEVFATVSTPEKRDLLIREYGLKKDHIFSSRDLSFAKGVMRMTGNRGVDVVLNSLSGDALRASWDILAPFGRFVEIGKRDAQANGRIELNPLLRQTVMASVDLTTIMNYKPKKLGQLIGETVRLFAEGKVRLAAPTRVMDYTQIEEGFRALQSGKSMGKIVFKPNGTDVVPIMPERPPPMHFDEGASYLLAGGMGGLGRSIARWMVSRGAKSLIFLSRSGAASDAAQSLVQELETAKCRVHIFACDVSDKAALSGVIETCKATLPPIKGCVQGSMVLKDAMFENMTYEDFNAALRPKFQGSWNLHEVLPTDMDFFLLLSSATGILGNRSQANYAAGNTYQDALALYRTCRGLPATSIDLGSILSVGYVAENKNRLKTIPTISSVLESIREDEIHLMIEYHLDPRRQQPAPHQTVSGLTDAALYRQRRMPVPSYLSFPLFRHLQSESAAVGEVGEGDDPVLMVPVQLAGAATMEEAVAAAFGGIRLKLARLLSISADDIDPGKSISSNGVDSLVATEFRTWLAKTLKADVPMLEIMGTSSILTFSEKVAGVSKLVQISSSS